MILTGPAILKALDAGEIGISPFNEEQVNPASYDVRLGSKVAWYAIGVMNTVDVTADPERFVQRATIGLNGFTIEPGVGYLMHTEERISPGSYVAVVDGKSSVGRLFVKVHETAGYIDPGFDGQVTLEVTTAQFKVRLRAGMRIAQVRFMKAEGEAMPYRGNYRGDTATGPVASRLWKQFVK